MKCADVLERRFDLKALLEEMEAYAARHHVPIINEQGRRAFQQVIEEAKPHRVLEIGTAIGYSALLMAQHGAEDVQITTLELSEERARLAESFWERSPYKERINLHLGDAGELLQGLPRPEGGFDFVFIDAAKGQYVDYFQKIQPLLAEKAVILADNVLFRGYVLGQEKPPRRFKTIVKRLQQYLQLVQETPGYSTKILVNGDGLAVTYKGLISEAGFGFEKT